MNWHGTDPNSLFKLLPLSNESLCSIEINSDFVELCDPFPIYYLDIGGQGTLDQFFEYVQSLDFTVDSNNEKLIRILKYSFSIRRIIDSLSGEDMINALHMPYLYDSLNGISCSLLLAHKGHFKQAQVLLRSSLETAVAHYYFTVTNSLSLEEKREEINNRIPNFGTSKNSMVKYLLEKNLLTKSLGRIIIEVYSDLNRYVHSSISVMDFDFAWEPVNEDRVKSDWYKNASIVYDSILQIVLLMLIHDVH